MRTTTAVTSSSASENARSQVMKSSEDSCCLYEEVAEIGNGAYGTVFKARDLRNDGKFVAKKSIRIQQETQQGMPTNAIREISLLKQMEKFDHPNIVRLLDVHHKLEGGPLGSKICVNLVFEYIDQDLAMYLERCPSPGLGPDRIRDLMQQLVCGVDFLHSNRIVHRDIKPQNILVTSNNQLKLADFGLARIYNVDMVLTAVVVTLWYRAPEVLLKANYAMSVDLWSCGCVFAELYTRKPLFGGTSESNQLLHIFQKMGLPPETDWPEGVCIPWDSFQPFPPTPVQEFVPEMNPQAQHLLTRLLHFAPEHRITAREALAHPYFNDDADSFRTSGSLSESGSSDGHPGTPVSK